VCLHPIVYINCRFWLLLRAPGSGRCTWMSVINSSKTDQVDTDQSQSSVPITEAETVTVEPTHSLTVAEKLRIIPSLLVYMIPLGLVYLFEYFINQGLVSNMKLCKV
jgi:hypothetical protein